MRKPVSGILSSLIVLAEEIVTRPGVSLGSPVVQERVMRLGVEVREADQAMYEGYPTTAAAVVTITCIEQYMLQENKLLSAQWLSLTGATLPLLREESFIALRNEREASRS